ncbi:MAG: PspC domain-containing protein [Bacteroidales bacterium]|nr:PspC domain-containing protein [Bacteroidales bacterium]
MKKTENVNIGGYPFVIEQDAYEKLEAYIKSISSIYTDADTAKELTSDIEERVSELLMEKCGKDTVICIDTINEIIKRIGEPDELAGIDESKEGTDGTVHSSECRTGTPGKTAENPRTPKRLFRDIEHRIIGGVCSGISIYFNIDVVIIRLLILSGLAALSYFVHSPYPMAFYLILWIAIPAAKTVEEKCRMTGKPMDLDDFRTRAEAARPVRDLGNEARTSPILKTTGNVLKIILGVFLIFLGISGLFSGLITLNAPHFISLFTESHFFNYLDPEAQQFLLPLISDRAIWWLTVSVIAIASILELYLGVLLTFNMKAPKWKPGIILIITLMAAVMLLATYLTRSAITLFFLNA